MPTKLYSALLAAIAGLIGLGMADTALAEKPGGPPGHAKHSGGHGASTPVIASGGKPMSTNSFASRDQTLIRQYFGQQFATGNCPPGLAKKNNGCLPPGQAKGWALGQRLPADTVYYPLPSGLLDRLTPAPIGYEYVRVVDDVLLMATATRIVVDAIRNLIRQKF